MIDGKKLFNQPIKNDSKTYDNFRTDQGDDYKFGCLVGCLYFKKYYKLIATDLSKWQKLDADLKAIQQINCTGNLNREEGATVFFIAEEVKERVLNFSKGTVKVLWRYFVLI